MRPGPIDIDDGMREVPTCARWREHDSRVATLVLSGYSCQDKRLYSTCDVAPKMGGGRALLEGCGVTVTGHRFTNVARRLSPHARKGNPATWSHVRIHCVCSMAIVHEKEIPTESGPYGRAGVGDSWTRVLTSHYERLPGLRVSAVVVRTPH